MIESGDKKEEYRTQNDYWIKGFVDGEYYGSDGLDRYKPFVSTLGTPIQR